MTRPVHGRVALLSIASLTSVLACAPRGAISAHWSYEGETGPAHWSDLSTAFAACATGRRQAPIDLPRAGEIDRDARPLAASYTPVPLSITNNGHTLQVDGRGGGALVVEGVRYDLVQLHFHAPSEHTIDGKHFDLEAHFVHANAAGALVVVAVFFERGQTSLIVDLVLADAPLHPSTTARGVAGATFDASEFVTAGARHWSYVGSLTTPPCTEGVRWLVLEERRELSDGQLAKFHELVSGESNRPVQPLHDRAVVRSR